MEPTSAVEEENSGGGGDVPLSRRLKEETLIVEDLLYHKDIVNMANITTAYLKPRRLIRVLDWLGPNDELAALLYNIRSVGA